MDDAFACLRRATSTQQLTHAQIKFFRIDWLGEIFVCARFKRHDAIRSFMPIRHDNSVGSPFYSVFDDVEAVFFHELAINNDNDGLERGNKTPGLGKRRRGEKLYREQVQVRMQGCP